MLITSRFRRDVLEGTIEELLPVGEEGSQERISNVTVGGRVKRQTSIPGPGDDNLDKSKLVVGSIEELLNFYIDERTKYLHPAGLTCASPGWRWRPRTGRSTARAACGQSSTTRSSSRPCTRRSARM